MTEPAPNARPRSPFSRATPGKTGAGRPFITLYTDSAEPSGMGAHMLALAAELKGRCDLALLVHDHPAARELADRARRLGVEAQVLPPSDRAWQAMTGWLRGRRPDVLHVHAGIGWEGLAAPGLARRSGVAAVVRTEHLPDLLTDAAQRADHQAMLADVDARICVSQASAATHAGNGLITVVPNGIPPARRPRAGRAALRHSLGLGPGAPVILTVARFTPQKAHADLLAAAAAVLAVHPDAVFLWVGDGVLRPELEGSVAAVGLRDRIRFLGPRDDVPDLMAAADLFVLPSHFEGLPLALLEAMQAQLPVVATTAPGTAEVFASDQAAELVAPGDSAALGRAILRVLGDPDLADELIDRGQRLVRTHHSSSRMADETYAVYRRLLERAVQRPSATLQ